MRADGTPQRTQIESVRAVNRLIDERGMTLDAALDHEHMARQLYYSCRGRHALRPTTGKGELHRRARAATAATAEADEANMANVQRTCEPCAEWSKLKRGDRIMYQTEHSPVEVEGVIQTIGSQTAVLTDGRELYEGMTYVRVLGRCVANKGTDMTGKHSRKTKTQQNADRRLAQVRNIVALVDGEGMALHEACDTIGVPPGTYYHWSNKLGIAPTTPKNELLARAQRLSQERKRAAKSAAPATSAAPPRPPPAPKHNRPNGQTPEQRISADPECPPVVPETKTCPKCARPMRLSGGTRCLPCTTDVLIRVRDRAMDLPCLCNTGAGIEAALTQAWEMELQMVGEPFPEAMPSREELTVRIVEKLIEWGVPEVDRQTLDKRAIRQAASTAIGMLKAHPDWTPSRAAEIALRELQGQGEWERHLGQPPLQAVEKRLLELIDERGRADEASAPPAESAPDGDAPDAGELVERIRTDVKTLGDLLADETVGMIGTLQTHVDGAAEALRTIRSMTRGGSAA